MSRVSIIVPVYNGGKVLERCVDSILTQDHRDIEVLLIDDGSKDDSYQIMQEYAVKDPRVIAIHKENGGVSSTRNLGLERATGDYVQFMDVDDWLPFDSTKQLVRAMDDSNCDMVISDFYRVIDDNVSRKGSIREGGIITRNQYADEMMKTPADFYYGVLWNKLYKKEIIDRHHIRMDEGISYCEDMIFNLEYLMHVENVSVLKAPVYYYVRTKGSLVEQNMNLQSTVKMKTSVIKYYNDFYRNILDEKDYEERKPIIYGYLVAVSTDAFSLPFARDTRKLGTEDGKKVFYDEACKGSDFFLNYLSSHLIDRLLNTAAQKHDLSLSRMKVLYVTYLLGRDCFLDEIAGLAGMSGPACLVELTRLTASGQVRITDISVLEENKVSYRYVNGELDEEFAGIQKDYESICFHGLDEDVINAYEDVRKVIVENLGRTMVK